jgi:hypothetical protein
MVAVVNAILAVYVFFDLGQRLSDEFAVSKNFNEICAAAGIMYDPDAVSDMPKFGCVFTRDPADELAFVKRLLGSDTIASTLGGGIVRYTGKNGEAIFRDNGAFELSLPDFEFDANHSDSAVKLARVLGLDLRKTDERAGTLTYVPVYDKREVFNRSAKFEFGATKGVTISGTYASGTATRVKEPKTSEFTTVAPKFWTALAENGYLLSVIYYAEAGYIYAESEYAVAWRFSTDVGDFIFSNGKITEG